MNKIKMNGGFLIQSADSGNNSNINDISIGKGGGGNRTAGFTRRN